jgi:hypothetical protein
MRALLASLEHRLRPGWLRPPSAPAIRVFESCFAVGELVLPWDAVSRIRAWRADTGAIRLDIGAGEDTGEDTARRPGHAAPGRHPLRAGPSRHQHCYLKWNTEARFR